MVGILNKKQRIMDTVMTAEGKRQLASGDFAIKFVSFTDAGVFYESDAISGSSDAGSRITFEATSLAQDAIAFEADDSGRLKARAGLFRDGLGVQNGKVVISTANNFLEIVTGSAFASSGSKLLKASIDNFRKLRIIGSTSPFDDEPEFILSLNSASFDMTPKLPLSDLSEITSANLDCMTDLFDDSKLSHAPNFKFLPPVNAPVTPNSFATPLGSFVPMGSLNSLTPSEVMDDIDRIEKKGNAIEIEFTDTSLSNNCFSQFYELRQEDMIKLDVVDYGAFPAIDAPGTNHVFFVGKVYTNGYGVDTFIHLFTLLFYDKIRKIGFR